MPDSLLTILKLAFLALLWLFFLRVLRAVWAELKEPAAVGAPVPGGRAGGASAGAAASRAAKRAGGGVPTALTIVEPAEDAGRTFAVGDEITLGRGAGCGIALPTDRMVSQLHARIFHGSAGELLVEDLGSTNGTTVNQSKVSRPTPLHQGDRVQVGRTVLEAKS